MSDDVPVIYNYALHRNAWFKLYNDSSDRNTDLQKPDFIPEFRLHGFIIINKLRIKFN